MKTIVILTGAGISAESGISTFRDNNGLWKQYRFEEVASPDAWARDPEMVMDFYNMRRKQLLAVEPNPAHYALAELEKKFRVKILTQNVDDLHERAGSGDILHLHGELKSKDGNLNLATSVKKDPSSGLILYGSANLFRIS